MNIAKGKIGNALTSTADNHVVAVSEDIYDESFEYEVSGETKYGMYQSDINKLINKEGGTIREIEGDNQIDVEISGHTAYVRLDCFDGGVIKIK